jgi:apolipoprotein N-acyltransferase
MSLVDFTKQAVEKRRDKVHLVVWPEGAVHFPILNSPSILREISGLASTEHTYVTAGSGEIGEKTAEGRREYFNTQFVVDPEGIVIGKYRKIILLAFGEYIPFVDALPFLKKWLPETISHFSRGTEKPLFPIGHHVNWLPLICYEDLITGFIRGFNHKKADFIVNVTNDGWFGKSDASHLHKQMARVRAVEYRKPMLRALNTGTSVVIDAAGRNISKETDLYIRDYINTTLHLPQTPPVTLYALLGNLPVYVLMAAVAGLWLKVWFQGRR